MYLISKKGTDMKSTEAVRKIMENKGIGPTKLAEMIGKSTPRIITDRLAQPNISIKLLKQMLDVLGYRIVIIPRTNSVPKNGIEIDA